ncbi:PucR family transcriptional regulator ligand-binding domain-containing protein [Slackia exigua]|uniref:PucR family transcriptional regulator ligand-binding domain-containing protein n=1 Tax=Slackia exigua TaxID=84109 RepID=UPI002004A6C8|nr:PucR family transcriptional regulator ligand-binding domain-containing protein [Slackia exigua]MCK6138396.1 PucR family transcriptional regulator ligand-binding domain-containing protein [Slackia exigua]
MDATIAEILSLSELKECRLLNPGVSLSQPVKSVTIMDNPEIFNWMSDYEILFSNGASLTSLNSMEWKAFFEGLSKKRSAGLFIKLQYYVDSIPEDAVEHAKRLDLPIVVVPNCYSWVRLSTPIQQYIIKEQFYLVNEALKLGDALNDAMVRGGELAQVCDVACRHLGCGVAVFASDGWYVLGGSSPMDWDSVSGLLKGQARGFSSLPGAFVLRDIEGSCKVIRVDKRTSRYYAVYWSLGSPELSVSDFDIDQVNSALMLCLIKERALRQIEEHYYYEFLSELIDGTLETTGEIKARASRLRRNVHDAYQLIVSSSDSAVRVDYDGFARTLKAHDDALVKDVMYCVKDDKAVFFCPVVSKEDRERVRSVCEEVRRYIGDGDVRFAVSRVHSVARIASACEEALSCLDFMSLVNDQCLFYDDLGLLRILAKNARSMETEFISDFFEDVLGKVALHDKESKVQLQATLHQFFLNDESIPDTARALGIHENTLRIRLKSIESLSGRSFKSSFGRVELFIASVLARYIP